MNRPCTDVQFELLRKGFWRQPEYPPVTKRHNEHTPVGAECRVVNRNGAGKRDLPQAFRCFAFFPAPLPHDEVLVNHPDRVGVGIKRKRHDERGLFQRQSLHDGCGGRVNQMDGSCTRWRGQTRSIGAELHAVRVEFERHFRGQFARFDIDERELLVPAVDRDL